MKSIILIIDIEQTHVLGKIVYILERKPNHLISGTLSLKMTRYSSIDDEKKLKVIWFKPVSNQKHKEKVIFLVGQKISTHHDSN